MLRHSAASVRRMLGGIAKTSGIAQFGDLAPSATGADKNVTIATGGVWMKGTQATDQGIYHGYNAPAKNIDMLTANPAHATLPRIDLVVAVVEDTFYGGATDNWYLRQVVGTPNASPVAPTAPANSFTICSVLIPAASTVIAIANITDLRTIAYFGAGGPWKFYRNLLTAAAASIAIPLPTAIPGLDDLVIKVTGRATGATPQEAVSLRFNNDAGSNYDYELKYWNGAGADVNAEIGGAAYIQLGFVPANTATAGYHGIIIARVPFYAGAVGNKNARAEGLWAEANTAGVLARVSVGAGKWRTVATPLTRVDVLMATTLAIGSLVSAQFE